MKKEEREKISRAPIVLSNHTVMVIHLFERSDEFEDFWINEYGMGFNEYMNSHRSAAVQFVAQLKDRWCIAFMEELIKECFKASMEDAGAGHFEWQRELISDLTKLIGFPIEADNETEKWDMIIEKYNVQQKWEKKFHPENLTPDHLTEWLKTNFKAPELK